MKLIIITCIKEYTDKAQSIFKEAGIKNFSTTDTTGFKGGAPVHLSENWFAKSAEQFDSAALFSFTEEQKAAQALSMVNELNAASQLDYPIHAYILPVEGYSM